MILARKIALGAVSLMKTRVRGTPNVAGAWLQTGYVRADRADHFVQPARTPLCTRRKSAVHPASAAASRLPANGLPQGSAQDRGPERMIGVTDLSEAIGQDVAGRGRRGALKQNPFYNACHSAIFGVIVC